MKSNHQFTLRVSDGKFNELKKEAEKRDITINTLIKLKLEANK